MLSVVLPVHVFFFFLRERKVSPDTCAAAVATKVTDVLSTGDAFLCAAAASTWSHDAFVSEHNGHSKKMKKKRRMCLSLGK